MTEIEQLRKEINELRERLSGLEARKQRIEGDEWTEMQKLKRAWDEAEKAKPPAPRPSWFEPPPSTTWMVDVPKRFTTLC
jgi:cell division septum initiation protein DivIVA